ncbi:MAG: ABC transporter permease [bacterium]|nr:ABC transporter permease [bacterium]
MIFKYNLKTALRGLEANKSRSSLTILGIVIGITAIMMVMSLGEGAQNLILSQIQTIGSKTIAILPGRQPKGIMDSLGTMFGDSLKERDVEALKKKSNVPNLAKIMPLVFGSASATYQNESYRLTIFGVDDLVVKIYDLEIENGDFFTGEDVKGRADVVVIGSKVKEELFGSSEAIGQKIKSKGRSLRVVGVLKKKGSGSMVNFDDAVFIPYSTAQQYLFGIKYYHRIIVEADSENNVSRTVEDIKITLRNMHNITDPEKDDFYIETQEGMMSMVSTVTSALTLFLAAVAAISLLVGGVGIMNIMLVSVTERTREIGLRKAIGATEKNILTQFLLEAVLLTATGGFIGIVLGASLSFLTSLVLSKYANLEWVFVFPVLAAFLGLGVSAAVGLVFGLYPARKAAQKNPIEALRYE